VEILLDDGSVDLARRPTRPGVPAIDAQRTDE